MSLKDFINNIRGGPQQSQSNGPSQPETAKQMTIRQAQEERTNSKPVAQISEAEKAKARELPRWTPKSGN